MLIGDNGNLTTKHPDVVFYGLQTQRLIYTQHAIEQYSVDVIQVCHTCCELRSAVFPLNFKRLSIPWFGKLIVRQNVRYFFASLGLMPEAGIPMLDALPLALDTIAEPHRVSCMD